MTTKTNLAVLMTITLGACTVTTEDGEPTGGAAGTLTYRVAPTAVPSIEVGDQTITLQKALLHVSRSELTSAFGEEVGASAEGRTMDLLAGEAVALMSNERVLEGEYSKFEITHGPAADGPAKGHTLVLEGTAKKGNETRTFVVRHDAELVEDELIEDYDFVADTAAIVAEVEFDVAGLFTDLEIDFFEEGVTLDGTEVRVDESNNAEMLERFEFNLDNAYGDVTLN